MLARAVILAAAFPAVLLAQRQDALQTGARHWVAPNAAPLLSLGLPGAGQLAQGKDRWVVYATVEALYWWRYSKDVTERRNAANEYKDLARRVARAHFQPNSGDGDWTYYESMRDYLESGNFSRTDAGPIAPETDSLTFNGRLWLLIRRTTPGCTDVAVACDAGLPRYTRGAVPSSLQWSWRNAQLQYDLYKRTTELRNDANHAATQDISVLVLNHLLSMVDAFSVLRLESHVDSRGRASIGANLAW